MVECAGNIGSLVWLSMLRLNYSWLELPVVVAPSSSCHSFSLMLRYICPFCVSVPMCLVGPFDQCGLVWKPHRWGTVEVSFGGERSWPFMCRGKCWRNIHLRNNQ